jgi:hypothetical protein
MAELELRALRAIAAFSSSMRPRDFRRSSSFRRGRRGRNEAGRHHSAPRQCRSVLRKHLQGAPEETVTIWEDSVRAGGRQRGGCVSLLLGTPFGCYSANPRGRPVDTSINAGEIVSPADVTPILLTSTSC